jgi:hypothetical protein
MLYPSELPHLVLWLAIGNHATTGAPHTVTAAGAFMSRPHSQAVLGRVAAAPGRRRRAR